MNKQKFIFTKSLYILITTLISLTAFLNSSIAQDSLNVTLLGSYDSPSAAIDVFVSGNYAYLANDVSGLRIIDITDSSTPTEVGFLTTNGTEDVYVSGDIVYLANRYGLRIVDVTDKTTPNELGFLAVGLTVTGRHPSGIYVSGNYAYVAEGVDVRIVDISDPTNPLEVSYFTTSGSANDVFINGNYAFVADENDGLRIIDITNPATPVEVGFYDTNEFAHRVYVKGNFAYVADRNDGLRIIDITDKTNPTEVGFYDRNSSALGIFVEGEYAYITEGNAGEGFGGLRVVNINNPTFPIEIGYYYTPDAVKGIFVINQLAYVADNWLGMYILHNDFITGIENELISPLQFSLEQNYPNPFNPSTIINFTLQQQVSVKLSIYNSIGKKLTELINREMNAGFHSINFDASSVTGGLSSGLYFYRISAGDFVDVKKMLLLK